jgi:two-component system chemotaxis response regulator CheY
VQNWLRFALDAPKILEWMRQVAMRLDATTWSDALSMELRKVGQMRSILAVDDSASMRQMVSFTLKAAGFNVAEAVDGLDAWDKAIAFDFDLIVTDQNMPRLDGVALTKRLRELPKFSRIPIVILSTESGEYMKQAGRAAGATGWLVKPFDPTKLIEVVNKLIGQPVPAEPAI